MFSIIIRDTLQPPPLHTPEDKKPPIRSDMYYRSERRGNTSFYDRVELTREEVDAKYERYRARVMEKGPWKGTLSGPWYDDSDLIVYGQTEEEAWRLIRDHLTEMREEIDKTLATLEPVSTSSQEAVKGVTTR